MAGVTYTGVRPTWAELDEDARVLLRSGVPLVVITLGGAGAMAADAQQMWFQPTKNFEALDTTGCGDAFAAGFLFGWCRSRDVRRGLVYGCACGGANVAEFGGSTPLDASAVNECMRRDEIIHRELSTYYAERPSVE